MSPRGWSVAVVVAVLLAAAAVPSAAVAQTPDQTINAQTDPEDAAAALNSGCGDDITNCKLASMSEVTNDYNPPRIVGDVLYNCAPPGGPTAYTSTSVTETRTETTSVSESLSVKLQGGLIGIASVSAQFTAFSSQAQSVSNSVQAQTTIPVPPGYKGYTTSQVLSAKATAAYNVTDGIHLIQVTGIDLTFPGYQDPNTNGDDAGVVYNTATEPISPFYPDPIHPGVPNSSYQGFPPCNAVSDAPNTTVVSSSLGGVQQKRQTGPLRVHPLQAQRPLRAPLPPRSAAGQDAPGHREAHPTRSHVRRRYLHPRAHPANRAPQDHGRNAPADDQTGAQAVQGAAPRRATGRTARDHPRSHQGLRELAVGGTALGQLLRERKT